MIWASDTTLEAYYAAFYACETPRNFRMTTGADSKFLDGGGRHLFDPPFGGSTAVNVSNIDCWTRMTHGHAAFMVVKSTVVTP